MMLKNMLTEIENNAKNYLTIEIKFYGKAKNGKDYVYSELVYMKKDGSVKMPKFSEITELEAELIDQHEEKAAFGFNGINLIMCFKYDMEYQKVIK